MNERTFGRNEKEKMKKEGRKGIDPTKSAQTDCKERRKQGRESALLHFASLSWLNQLLAFSFLSFLP